MEGIGAFLDQEWESLSKMFSFEEDSGFLNSDNVFGEIPSSDFFSGGGGDDQNDDDVAGFDGSLFLPSDDHHHHSILDDANFYYVSQESSQSGSNEINHAEYRNGVNSFEYSTDFGAMMNGENDSMSSMVVPVFTDDVMEEILQLKAELLNEELGNADASCKRKYETSSESSPKKKPRISRNAQKKTRNVPQSSKKNKKAIICNDDEEVNIVKGNGENGQSSSTCSSEGDDSNASQEVMDIGGGAVSEPKKSASNGKAKAGKGTATDPQSLYARKRREKINERLRILQNLVPNGTKVDISTMLEEAVHYVKFLQLQIKLLSSDEMWMYAPIAYNGMDMGLYQKINNLPNLCSHNL